MLVGAILGLVAGGGTIYEAWTGELFLRPLRELYTPAAIILLSGVVLAMLIPRVVGAGWFALGICMLIAGAIRLFRGEPAFALGMGVSFLATIPPQAIAYRVLGRADVPTEA